MKKEKRLIDYHLLRTKIPESVTTTEKVTERILGKKISPKKKTSVKWKAAIKNYGTAITRYKRAVTLLEKHHKILSRIVKKYKHE